MATYKFNVAPGVTAPEGAPPLTLTNIRPVVPPAGRAKDLLDRMTGDYTAFQQARISQTLFDLIDAGILAKLDLLCIRGSNEHDSLVNWAGEERPPANFSALFTQGVGFSTDGEATYLDMNFDPGNYAVGDASIFSFLPEGAPKDYAFANSTSGTQRGQINIGFSSATGRINHDAGVAAAHDDKYQDCLWSIIDRQGEVSLLRDGEQLVSTTPGGTAALPQNGIAIGRRSTIYNEALTSAFGYGAALTAQQAGVLSSAIRAMNAVI